jgi:hypothetical protein
VCCALLLSSPVTLSRNGYVAHSCSPHRSLFRGMGVWRTPPVTLLRAGWVGSSGAVESWRVLPCGAAAGRLLLAYPASLSAHCDPPLLPLPPGEAPPRSAPAPPQAGHKRRRPAAPPYPSRPTAAALLTADPCKSARTAGTPPLLPLPPGEALLRAAHAPPQAGHRRRRPVAPPSPRGLRVT